MIPDFGDIGQMLGLKVNGVPIIVELPLTPPVCQDPNDLGVIEPLVEPIERLRGDRTKIIKLVDRLRANVYQHTPHPDFLDDVGGEVGLEFSTTLIAAGRGGWQRACHPLALILVLIIVSPILSLLLWLMMSLKVVYF